MADTPLTRRTVLLGLAGGFAGCLDTNDETDNAENPALDAATQQGDLRLTSPAFDDGEAIPDQYGYERANVNPPLTIENVPDGAASLAIVVDDPDAVEPAGQIWVHWLVWNVSPDTTAIPEDWTPRTAIEGSNDFGEVGYGGPNPPDAEHTYRFKLYALEQTLSLERGANVEAVGTAIDGHVIERTQLTGTYAP